MNEVNGSAELRGKCSCGNVEYQLLRHPMFVHCCHCSWCQRETGSAFAINALIETPFVRVTKGSTSSSKILSNSGTGQTVVHCPSCRSVLWSHYGAAGDKVAFVRVGTLDTPDHCKPDIHIFTSTKQDWVVLSDDAPIVEEYYRRREHWPVQSVERYKLAIQA